MIVKSTCYCIKFWSNINEYWESFRSAAFEVVIHIFKFDLAQGVAMLLRITSLVWVGTTNQAIWGKATQRSRVEIRIAWRQNWKMSIFNSWIRGQINYSRVQKSIENCSVWSKMALEELGLSLPCPSGSRLLKAFFKSHNFFVMEKWPVSEEF